MTNTIHAIDSNHSLETRRFYSGSVKSFTLAAATVVIGMITIGVSTLLPASTASDIATLGFLTATTGVGIALMMGLYSVLSRIGEKVSRDGSVNYTQVWVVSFSTLLIVGSVLTLVQILTQR